MLRACARTSAGGRLTPGPRTVGMMQNVQCSLQPSWTCRVPRVRPSATAPSICRKRRVGGRRPEVGPGAGAAGGSWRRPGGARPEMGAHPVDETGLVGIGDHQAGPGPAQFLGPPLGVAAGGHHQRLGVASAGPAHGAARIGVAGAGDRAGVDHVHVGFLGEGDHAPAAAVEPGLEGLGLVLVQLAAEVVDGDARKRGALVGFGHRRKTLWEKE